MKANIEGKKFNKLKVLRDTGERKGKSRATIWECICECGNITKVITAELKNGHTKSCGCLKSPPMETRFMEKIKKDKNTGCWEWQGGIIKGYGQFWNKPNTVQAHRFSYEHFMKQKIPKGILVCHNCDNRRCVNPDHLFLGTHQDNADDMVKKGRQARNFGNKNGNFKTGNYCREAAK